MTKKEAITIKSYMSQNGLHYSVIKPQQCLSQIVIVSTSLFTRVYVPQTKQMCHCYTLSCCSQCPLRFLGIFISILVFTVVIADVTKQTCARPTDIDRFDSQPLFDHQSTCSTDEPSCIITTATSAVLAGSQARSVDTTLPTVQLGTLTRYLVCPMQPHPNIPFSVKTSCLTPSRECGMHPSETVHTLTLTFPHVH